MKFPSFGNKPPRKVPEKPKPLVLEGTFNVKADTAALETPGAPTPDVIETSEPVDAAGKDSFKLTPENLEIPGMADAVITSARRRGHPNFSDMGISAALSDKAQLAASKFEQTLVGLSDAKTPEERQAAVLAFETAREEFKELERQALGASAEAHKRFDAAVAEPKPRHPAPAAPPSSPGPIIFQPIPTLRKQKPKRVKLQPPKRNKTLLEERAEAAAAAAVSGIATGTPEGTRKDWKDKLKGLVTELVSESASKQAKRSRAEGREARLEKMADSFATEVGATQERADLIAARKELYEAEKKASRGDGYAPENLGDLRQKNAELSLKYIDKINAGAKELDEKAAATNGTIKHSMLGRATLIRIHDTVRAPEDMRRKAREEARRESGADRFDIPGRVAVKALNQYNKLHYKLAEKLVGSVDKKTKKKLTPEQRQKRVEQVARASQLATAAGAATFAFGGVAGLGLAGGFAFRVARAGVGGFVGMKAAKKMGTVYKKHSGEKKAETYKKERGTTPVTEEELEKQRKAYVRGNRKKIEQEKRAVEFVTALAVGAGLSLSTSEAISLAQSPSVSTIANLPSVKGATDALQHPDHLPPPAPPVHPEVHPAPAPETPHAAPTPPPETHQPTAALPETQPASPSASPETHPAPAPGAHSDQPPHPAPPKPETTHPHAGAVKSEGLRPTPETPANLEGVARHGDGAERMFQHLQESLKHHHADSPTAKLLLQMKPETLAKALHFLEYPGHGTPLNALVHQGDSLSLNDHDQLVFTDHLTGKTQILMHADSEGVQRVDNIFQGKLVPIHHIAHHVSTHASPHPEHNAERTPSASETAATTSSAATEAATTPPSTTPAAPDSTPEAAPTTPHDALATPAASGHPLDLNHPAPPDDYVPHDTPADTASGTTPDATAAHPAPGPSETSPADPTHGTSSTEAPATPAAPEAPVIENAPPTVDALTHTVEWSHYSQGKSLELFNATTTEPGTPADTFRTQMLGVLRESGTAPHDQETVLQYVTRAAKDIQDHIDKGLNPLDTHVGIYEDGGHLVAHGGDPDAQLLVAREYALHNPDAQVIAGTSKGLFVFSADSLQRGTYDAFVGKLDPITAANTKVY